MPRQIVKRVGTVLVAIGIIDGMVTILRLAEAGPYSAVIDGIALVAGIALLTGGPRVALWVRSVAAFWLAACAMVIVVAPLFQPLDLSLTEIRLDPMPFADRAGCLIVMLGVSLWVTSRLGHRAVQDAIIDAGGRRWDMGLPAQAGAAVIALAGLLLWLTLHGQSAALATSLALEQLGPDYRYHLSWISSARNGHGTTITGVVTAWNEKEIKVVLLHWETK
jgi:hypothetical protein